MVNGENVTLVQRLEGYYKQPHQLVVEKVQIPEETNAVITFTDKEGDGFCESPLVLSHNDVLLYV